QPLARGACHRLGMRVVLVALFLAMPAVPAFAQVDFSGAWASLYQEDLPERLPGPELGDYMGLPINDAARLRGDSYDADRISIVPEYQCRPRRRLSDARAVEHAHRSRARPGHPAARRLAHAHGVPGNGADDLDGRSLPSRRYGAAHLVRLLDRHVAEQI